MTELYEKSLRKLELDNVLAQLADCANSEDGKDRCRALLPLDDAEEIRLLQQQTTSACGMIVRKGAPGFHELKPVAASLERADRGGCLTPVELLRIAGVLRCIRNVKAYYSEDGEPTVLDVYFQELSPNRYLEEKITNSILSEEEIADAASSELADIRRHMRIQSAKVKDSLQKIISSPSFPSICATRSSRCAATAMSCRSRANTRARFPAWSTMCPRRAARSSSSRCPP